MVNGHVLNVTFPGQAHINPSLQFATHLAKHGVKVTFLTSLSSIRRMSKASSSSSPSFQGLIEFVSFSDGYDSGWSIVTQDLVSALRKHGSKAVEVAIAAKREEGHPFTRVIYIFFIPWAGQVAHRLQVPITLLWIQPAILFGLYFYYFNKYFNATARDDEAIELPGIPVLDPSDLPSFLQASDGTYDFALPTFRENFEILDRENYPTVLVNSFDSLEPEALRVIDKYKLMTFGPLVPASAFSDGNDPSDTSYGGDLVQKSVDYAQWLNSKEKSSAIYVAFGSYSELSKPQMKEIAKGLIKSGRPFLWVIRGIENSGKLDEIVSCREDLEKQGKIVPWCSQVEVLSHPSVGCYVTHCGWNSSIESLVAGVPFVLFPLWTDQPTNAKLIQDLWRSGVRVVKSGNGGLVEADEFKRCLEIVMHGGEREEEIRRQAKKWRDLAKEAMKEDGGSSNLSLKIYIDQFINGGHQVTLER